jgi:hypothetical protein
MQVSLSPIIRSQIFGVFMLTIVSSECQRSFTYVLDHCRLSVLLEFEQNNVYDRHLESLRGLTKTVQQMFLPKSKL